MSTIIYWLNQNEGAASIFLAIISLAAAIGIPSLIAHKQNKIALYEKRLECYQQLQALKHFAEFCGEQETFHVVGRIDPIYQCQEEYLSAHYSDLDKNYLQNWKYLRDSYVALALEKDRVLFQSLIYLQLFKNATQSNECFDALETFVTSLFTHVTADRVGGDPTPNRLAHIETLKKERDAFNETLYEFLKAEKAAQRKLKL